MTDREKVRLICDILNQCWECEPSDEAVLQGYYYGILTALGIVAFKEAEDKND